MQHVRRFICVVTLISMTGISYAQEFPIAVGSDTTFSGGAVYGGLNGLVTIHGNSNNQNSITAQLVGASGQLIGPRISLGAVGVMPGAMPVFDGTNYFLVWLEFNGSLKGQFVSTSGSVVGTSSTIATNISTERPMPFSVVFSDSTFLVIFVKVDGHLYGQRVGKTGNLLGSQILISSNLARDFSIAFDGTNFLVIWVEVIPESDKDIFGQFVSKAGSLVGTNFLIDGGQYLSDNPTSLAFDGTRYLLAFHEAPDTNSNWTLMGRFITTSGTIQETIIICDSLKAPQIPSVAFDHSNYLITWMQGSNGSLMARFFSTSGTPIDTPFVVFAPLGNKIPFGGVGFGGGLYLIVATRVDSNFTNGDVYGRFLQPVTGVADEDKLMPASCELSQNYPNPFNPTTTIRYALPQTSFVTLTVYNTLGQTVSLLVHEQKEAGIHNVVFNGDGLASSVYFYRLQAGEYVATKKLILLR
ncbi:MAG: T9SS type A sorting domain-containing protein [Ignavibacteriae bacterium]|nr:T9SS type A sorting domain-containing protein [Ignavibacteriota bacterium]